MRVFSSCSAALLFGLSACAPPPVSPGIELVFPFSDDSLVYCTEFLVLVDIDQLLLSAENYDGDVVPGEGHWHLKIDDALYATSTNAWLAVEGVEEGLRSLRVSLQGNDHADLEVNGELFEDIVEITVGADDDGGCVGSPEDLEDAA